METLKRLQTNRDALLEQYYSNLDDIYNLQDTLIRDILPSVSDELELGPESQEWAKEWLSDTPSVFRISRRNKFTRSFCLEAIQKILLWRLDNLWPVESHRPIPNLHCLPSEIRDPFGRPVLILEAAPVDIARDSQKRYIIQAFEQLRLHLKNLYDSSEDDARPPLQYVILFDLGQLSLQSINVDLFSWTIREVIPRFSGMIAAGETSKLRRSAQNGVNDIGSVVFMLNYSWAHAGLWNIFKRLLPETALSRVFFPSKTELINYFSPTALPKEYGGSLPTLALLEDPIRLALPSPEVQEALSAPVSPAVPEPSSITTYWMSPTSLLNPFFGYPVSASSTQGTRSFRHGRRRKRDLVRTLLSLLWIRWRKHISIGLSLAVLVVVLRIGLRNSRIRFPRRLVPRWLLANRVPFSISHTQ